MIAYCNLRDYSVRCMYYVFHNTKGYEVKEVQVKKRKLTNGLRIINGYLVDNRISGLLLINNMKRPPNFSATITKDLKS